ncbi:DedA family protein [Longispora sp. NPDC051575]|uniref:DedA family protein n=1 Tax=Longispora sp. NPDC051575 TaxID=3154943 RepID=UPI00341A3ED1
MHFVEGLLDGLPPMVVYLIVGAIIGVESMGIPLPGEVVLVSASLMASTHIVSPLGVAIAASLGAIVGDTIGYTIGRRGGRPLLERLGRRFPKHLGPKHLAKAEETFDRWGVWAVFFGRFIALLRILAGPLAGALRVPYPRFLVANAAGGILWASGTTYAIYYVGRAAEKWLKGFSWVALVVAVLFGLGTTFYIKRKIAKSAAAIEEAERAEPAEPAETGTGR